MSNKLWFCAAVALGLSLLLNPAHAQSASAVFAGPQNMDAGLQNGLNNLTGYVHFLPSQLNSLKAKVIPIIQGEDGDCTVGACSPA